MNDRQKAKLKEPYVYVKDDQGVVYICRQNDLKNPEKMTPEEKDVCMIPPGDA